MLCCQRAERLGYGYHLSNVNITVFLGENVIQIAKMQSSVATNLHYFSILFYNKSQKVEDSGNSRFVLIHALRLHCWVHTKECRFFTLPDWFDSIFAVTGGSVDIFVFCQITFIDKD